MPAQAKCRLCSRTEGRFHLVCACAEDTQASTSGGSAPPIKDNTSQVAKGADRILRKGLSLSSLHEGCAVHERVDVFVVSAVLCFTRLCPGS